MTDREKIIEFLLEHPDWVDAYRLVNPDRHITLAWMDGSPYVYGAGPRHPVAMVNDASFTLPPTGEWQPKPESEVHELSMIASLNKNVSYGQVIQSALSGDRVVFDVHAHRRFAGHRVRVTVEVIDDDS